MSALAKAIIWDKVTSVYYKLLTMTKRVIVVPGGGQAGKTIAVLQILGEYALNNPRSIISVFGMTYNHLETGALRQFRELIELNLSFSCFIVNPDLERGPYKFKNGSIIEFISLDKPGKALGAKRHVAFFNEANFISFETYTRVKLRTEKKIYIDFNPYSEFWVHGKVLPFKDECQGFVANYTHNEYAPPEAVAELIGYYKKWKETGSPYWRNQWLTLGLGETGIPEGVVFPHIEIVERFPDKSQLKHFGYGVDWGFTKDPTTVIKCGITLKGEFVGQELFYHTRINAYSMDDEFSRLVISKEDPIIADSANPDAINWLQKKGWNIMPADKPPGSVKQGIELLNEIGINIVQGSENWLNERSRYVYKTKMGVIDMNDPEDANNHCFDPAAYFCRFAIHNKGVNPKKMRKGEREAFVV